MVFKEVCQDLFTVPDDYYLAHCISADFALGAGIAVQFNRRFDLRRHLKELCPRSLSDWDFGNYVTGSSGACIKVGRVLNLVTKRNYWDKPTYKNMFFALKAMKRITEKENIKKIAMPRIGCGLDRLNWLTVTGLIKDTFKDSDIEILVCFQ